MMFLSAAKYISNSLSIPAVYPVEQTEQALAREALAQQSNRALRNILLMQGIRAWYLRRMGARQLDRAIVRLSEVSPHLLNDIGVETTDTPARYRPVPKQPEAARSVTHMFAA